MTRWACCLLLWLFCASTAHAADVEAQCFDSLPRFRVALEDAKAGPPEASAPGWQTVALPDIAIRAVRNTPARSPTMSWYLLRWTAPAGLPPGTPLAVYVPRVIAQPAQLWQRGAAGWVQVFDNQGEAHEQWNRPLLITLPPQAAAGAALELAVGVPSRHGRFHALSSVCVGPQAALRGRYSVRSALQVGLPEAASLAMVALGLLSFIVWLSRRAERAYLYFACTALAWTMRNLHLFIDWPSSGVLFDAFWWMTTAAVSWLMLATYLFAFRFDSRRLPRAERALTAFVLAASIATVPGLLPVPLLVQHGANLAVALAVTGLLTALAVAGGTRELRVIVVALWCCLAMAVHDWLLVALRITPETIYLLPYGSMLLMGAFLYAALRRFTGAVQQAESASRVLAARLAERERELAAQHEQLLAVERDQTLLLERQRLMRDMHDGVGSHLIALLRLADSGAGGEAMADLLRSAIEDLRLTIDSLEPLEHDLATLLATLRTRVGRRLESAGLTLEWHMADMPPLPWLEPAQALQVLRLIQEAMTNVIKHAQARTLSLSARQEGDALEVRIEDDGCGFDLAAASAGHGLASMRQRAQVLGAALCWDSTAGRGTRVCLRLPLAA